MDDELSSDWIPTNTGKIVLPTAMTAEMVDIRDIAFSLSHINRFTGHVGGYSVAQHSVLGSYLCDKKYAKEFLLHDAHEYVFADVARPVKNAVRKATPILDLIESNIAAVVRKKFGLPLTCSDEVKRRDNDMLAHEAAYYWSKFPKIWNRWKEFNHNYWAGRMDDFRKQQAVIEANYGIYPWSASHAESRFLARFRELTPPSLDPETR